jgi:hypothetical protein
MWVCALLVQVGCLLSSARQLRERNSPRSSHVPLTEPSVLSEKKAGGMERRFVRTLLFVVTGEEQSNLVKGRIKRGPQ